jgi:hypothetical protein
MVIRRTHPERRMPGSTELSKRKATLPGTWDYVQFISLVLSSATFLSREVRSLRWSSGGGLRLDILGRNNDVLIGLAFGHVVAALIGVIISIIKNGRQE